MDANGRATGVTYLIGGRGSSARARRAARNVRLREHPAAAALEVSAFPNGLSNNHGQVGRHYISHGYAGAAGGFRSGDSIGSAARLRRGRRSTISTATIRPQGTGIHRRSDHRLLDGEQANRNVAGLAAIRPYIGAWHGRSGFASTAIRVRQRGRPRLSAFRIRRITSISIRRLKTRMASP